MNYETLNGMRFTCEIVDLPYDIVLEQLSFFSLDVVGSSTSSSNTQIHMWLLCTTMKHSSSQQLHVVWYEFPAHKEAKDLPPADLSKAIHWFRPHTSKSARGPPKVCSGFTDPVSSNSVIAAVTDLSTGASASPG